jgi:iron complex transport system substrate-binding protein
VVQIGDAKDFAGIRRNIRVVAAALDSAARGEDLIHQMDIKLELSRGAWSGKSALYLTPSGFTAGDGTLIGAIMRSAGLKNAARRSGYSAAPLESLVLAPPRGFVLGFFDQLSAAFERWGMGRHAALKRQLPDRTLASLPGSVLSCPAWFAADGVEILANSAR